MIADDDAAAADDTREPLWLVFDELRGYPGSEAHELRALYEMLRDSGMAVQVVGSDQRPLREGDAPLRFFGPSLAERIAHTRRHLAAFLGADPDGTALVGNASIVAGSAENAAGERRAFFWWDGNELDLNQLVAPGFTTPAEAAFLSDVVAINDRMEMVATLSAGSQRDGSLRFLRHILLVRRGTR